MKRPILVAIIGYIIGILWGLYFKMNIVPFNFIIIASYFSLIYIYRKIKNTKNNFKLISIKRYFRYIKLVINEYIIITFIFFSIISNIVIKTQEMEYESVYKRDGDIGEFLCTVESNCEEKEYYNIYKVKVIESDNFKDFKQKCFFIKVKKNIFHNLEYGDMIQISGNYKNAESQRNYGGFNYQTFLKTKKIFGIIEVSNVKKLDNRRVHTFMKICNDINCKIKEYIDRRFKNETGQILKGLLLGDSSNIEEKIKENFRNASISHVLAISGMHISYVIVSVTKLFNKVIGKRITKLIIIILLFIYMCITGFSPSVIRATITGILVIFSNLVCRKNDFWTSIAISLFLIIIYNPYLIINVGLQLSYLGVIGIIIFQKTILKMLDYIKIGGEKRKRKNQIDVKITEKIKEFISVCISVQITTLPIILYHYNTFNPYFLISNFFISIVIGTIIILGIIYIILSFISIFFSDIVAIFLELGLQFIIFISKIGELPFSNIYIPTPNILQIFMFYIIAVIIKFLFHIFYSKEISVTR